MVDPLLKNCRCAYPIQSDAICGCDQTRCVEANLLNDSVGRYVGISWRHKRRSMIEDDSGPQRSEGRAQLRHEGLRLFPCRKVRAFVEPVVVDELGIRALGPAPWCGVDLEQVARRHHTREARRPVDWTMVLPNVSGISKSFGRGRRRRSLRP